jgi:hypothetical protein
LALGGFSPTATPDDHYGLGGRILLDQGGLMIGCEVEVNLQNMAVQEG